LQPYPSTGDYWLGKFTGESSSGNTTFHRLASCKVGRVGMRVLSMPVLPACERGAYGQALGAAQGLEGAWIALFQG
jgi:hypothetical protein